MANINKVEIPVAQETLSKLDLSCDHVTTFGFMRNQPVYYRHMIKGERINVLANAVVRPFPLVVPTYGRMRLNLRAFYVPYRLCFPHYDSFKQDVIASNAEGSAIPQEPPYFYERDLWDAFTFQSVDTVPYMSVDEGDGTPDFYRDGFRWRLLPQGMYFYKVLQSLGYKFVVAGKDNDFRYNALALLAWAKIYYDWYSNSQYLNSAGALRVSQILSYNDPLYAYRLGVSDIRSLLEFVSYVLYDSNGYFENAWDNPTSPVSGQFTPITFLDASLGTVDTTVTTALNGTPHMRQGSSSSLDIGTQYLHDALRKITDFQKRHALAGARAIDRVLATYGKETDYLKTMRCIYIGGQSVDIDTGAVYATAAGSNDTGESSVVGDYAGTGKGTGSKVWDFTCEEDGILIVCASLLPSGGYYQGYDRNNTHMAPLDFFTPEMDGLSVQAIEKGEVFVSRQQNFAPSQSDYQRVFGFTGRYGEYKRPISFVTGAIDFPRVFIGGNSWHLMRDLSDYVYNVANLVHSLSFTRGRDSGQYHRLFSYTLPDVDPFIGFLHFDVGSYCPCKPLFETYDFEGNGRKITMDTNGTKLN